jgi:hypothetical protein
MSDELGLTGEIAAEWTYFTSNLRGAGIGLVDNHPYELRWMRGERSGELTVDNCYKAIINTQNLPI